MELKTAEILIKIQSLDRKNTENPKIGDTMCRKHENQIFRIEKKLLIMSLYFLLLIQYQIKLHVPLKANQLRTLTVVKTTQNYSSPSNCNATFPGDLSETEQSFIMVDMPRTYASHWFCFICKQKSGKIFVSKIQRIYSKLIFQALYHLVLYLQL